MGSVPINDLESNVKILMSPEDEVTWRQVGLFDKVDDSGSGPLSRPTLTNKSNLPSEDHGRILSLPLHSSGTSHPFFSSAGNLGAGPLPTAFPGVHTGSSTLGGNCIPLNSKPTNYYRRNQWKTNRKAKRMVLGNDVGLEDTCRLTLCDLVGRISYSYLSKDSLELWINSQWLPLIGYIPKVMYLTKGWIGFICNFLKDVTLLLSSFWVFGGSSIMLKWWRIAFNLDSDYFYFRNLWVILPSLPLYLWNEGAL
jgi:hypothetical protein